MPTYAGARAEKKSLEPLCLLSTSHFLQHRGHYFSDHCDLLDDKERVFIPLESLLPSLISLSLSRSLSLSLNLESLGQDKNRGRKRLSGQDDLRGLPILIMESLVGATSTFRRPSPRGSVSSSLYPKVLSE